MTSDTPLPGNPHRARRASQSPRPPDGNAAQPRPSPPHRHCINLGSSSHFRIIYHHNFKYKRRMSTACVYCLFIFFYYIVYFVISQFCVQRKRNFINKLLICIRKIFYLKPHIFISRHHWQRFVMHIRSNPFFCHLHNNFLSLLRGSMQNSCYI